MNRAILLDGDIRCDRFDRTEHGVELYVEDEMAAFVPYANLVAVTDPDVSVDDERGTW